MRFLDVQFVKYKVIICKPANFLFCLTILAVMCYSVDTCVLIFQYRLLIYTEIFNSCLVASAVTGFVSL